MHTALKVVQLKLMAGWLSYLVISAAVTVAFGRPHLTSTQIVENAIAKHRSRFRRQITSLDFAIIQNSSFACDDVDMVQRGVSYTPLPRVVLSDSELTQVLEGLGGQYVKSYMASNPDRAQTEFPNILTAPSSQTPHGNSRTRNGKRSTRETKEDIIQHLSTISEDISKEWDTIEGIGRDSYKVKDTVVEGQRIARAVGAQSPFKTPEELGLQKSTVDTATGKVTILDYCLPRGHDTGGGYLSMCTVCAATVQLPHGHWPAFLNEVVCATTDLACMVVGNIPAGRCKQQHIPLKMLRRREGRCSLALQNGGYVIVDHYEIQDLDLNIACGCTIQESSPFGSFVAG